MKLIDTHAHLQFSQFASDREAVIKRCHAADLSVINVGTDLNASAAAVALAHQQPNFWATVGLHPTDWAAGFDDNAFRELARDPKVVAVGECGLDYLRLKTESEKPRQAEIFERQIQLARELNKPLVIHCRQAYDELAARLAAYPGARGVIHFFSGSWGAAKKFLDLGFYLSFSGVVTFATDYDETVKNAPGEMILAETDCPFAAPHPWRGRRNEPLYVRAVMEKIADLRGQAAASLAEQLWLNAQKLFF